MRDATVSPPERTLVGLSGSVFLKRACRKGAQILFVEAL